MIFVNFQALYGTKNVIGNEEDSVYNKSSKPIKIDADNHELCFDSKIDTIFISADGTVHVFKGMYSQLQ